MTQASKTETRTSFCILVDNGTGHQAWAQAKDDSAVWKSFESSQSFNHWPQEDARRADADSTNNHPFEHFEADVVRYFSKLNGGHVQDSDARIKQLVKQILESSDPSRRISTIVEICCRQPTQDRIDKGACLLARMPQHVVEFLRNKDETDFGQVAGYPIPRHSRYWLYTQIPPLVNDPQSRRVFVALLHDWLKDTNSEIREGSAITLGEVGDKSTIARLHEALEAEKDASVRDAIQDSLRDLAAT